jgi:hypothetical protein
MLVVRSQQREVVSDELLPLSFITADLNATGSANRDRLEML